MEQGRDKPQDMTDIDAVLGLATAPEVPAGAMDRLMARIAEEPQDLKVVAFTPRLQQSRSIWRLAAAVPLAASLALGVYLGAQGKMDVLMPNAITGGVALNDDVQLDDLGGVGDAEAYAQEGTT